jgi:hypothetical protein
VTAYFAGAQAERLAGLEQRLQAAQNAHPSDTGDAPGGLGRALELVVGDGQQAMVTPAPRLDLPRHPAGRLLHHLRVVQRPPAVYKSPRRVEFIDLLVAPHRIIGAE